MAKNLQHTNGNVICAIDVETTGLNPLYHEITQISIVALNSELEPNKDFLPFLYYFKPEHPERYDMEARRVSGIDLETLNQRGVDQTKCQDMLLEWVEKLQLPFQKRIMPLGHNYGFDKSFIQEWLGPKTYDLVFDYHYRDSMTLALGLNDWFAFRGAPCPFPFVNLSGVCRVLGVSQEQKHDAYFDAMASAQAYRAMIKLMPHDTLMIDMMRGTAAPKAKQ